MKLGRRNDPPRREQARKQGGHESAEGQLTIKRENSKGDCRLWRGQLRSVSSVGEGGENTSAWERVCESIVLVRYALVCRETVRRIFKLRCSSQCPGRWVPDQIQRLGRSEYCSR